MANDGHQRRAFLFVGRLQPAAQCRRDAEGAQRARRAGGTMNGFGMISAKIDGSRYINTQFGERGCLFTNVEIVRSRKRLITVRPQMYQPVAIGDE